MTAQTSAGSTISIDPALPATNDDTGFSALTAFELIGEVESIGGFGTEYNEVTFTAVNDRRVRKFKGSYNPGSVAVTAALDSADTGQVAVQSALDTDDDVSFKVELQDGSVEYFTGKVMSYTTEISSADNITMTTINIGINSDIIKVAAA